MPATATPPTILPESRAIRVGIVLLFAFHAWAVTVGWRSSALPGQEFRQTQTAITALFIQRDHNFDLAYPTPVLGKPWSVPFEFPLYQWAVAGLSTAVGCPLHEAGRAVSLVCFYLCLPAVWLLLGRLGAPPLARWIVLGLMLTCPIYIFYVRAFLIETMALMFGLWFLAAFVAAVADRRVPWLMVANVAGIGAGLVKVTTLIVYLLPAAAVSLVWLWRDRPRPGAGAGAFVRTAGWIAAATAGPLAATWWWTRLADSIKALNPSGSYFVSTELAGYTFGTWAVRLTPDTWSGQWRLVAANVASLPVLLVLAALWLAGGAGRWRRWVSVPLPLA